MLNVGRGNRVLENKKSASGCVIGPTRHLSGVSESDSLFSTFAIERIIRK